MPAFTYHPAPLSAPVTVMLSENSISDGALTLRVAGIVAVRHVSRRFRGVRSDYLDLINVDDARLRLACSGPARRWGKEENSAAYIALLAQIARLLAESRPDLTVSLDDAPPWRWAWFSLGLATVMLGAGITGFALHDGVELERLLPVLPVMGLMAVLGLAIAWSNRPWRAERSTPMVAWRMLMETAPGGSRPRNP